MQQPSHLSSAGRAPFKVAPVRSSFAATSVKASRWPAITPGVRRAVHLSGRMATAMRGTPVPIRGSIGRSRPAFYSLGRGVARRRGSRLRTTAKVFQPGSKEGQGEEGGGGDLKGIVSVWTGRIGGFVPLRNRKDASGRHKNGHNEGTSKKEEEEGFPEKGPYDSDDVDMFESFAESEASRDKELTLDEAKLEAIVEDDWPRLTAEALAGAWREWRRFVLTRMGIYALWLSGILFASTGLSYYIGRHFVNQALPWMSATVSQAANRPIRIGRCKGLWPAGLLGAGSFLDVGPLVIGPAEAERSIVEVAKVKLSLRPIASLLQFKIVVAAHLEGVQATLRQGDNGSWLGYPEDTLPLSARPTISMPRRGGPGGDSDDGGRGAQLALESVRVVNGTASLHLAGDPDPRLLKRMNGTVTISRRGRLELDMAGNPVSRGVVPSERPATMKCDTLPRHLRAEQTAAEKCSLAREVARGTDGGHVRCFLSLVPNRGNNNGRGGGSNDLKVRIQLNNTSAAVVERTIPNLPIDVSTGRLDGELRLRCHSKETWAFPEFGGQIRCRGLSFHFWDAPDNFAETDVDLIFEGTRMYLHGGKGYYGAVPLAASGDMDLFPGDKNMRELRDLRDQQSPRPKVVQLGSGHSGEYRISAQVSGVDTHALRETLGVKPPPRPMAGAVRGFLYVGGPLDFPIFTGSAETIPPKPEDLSRGVPGTEAALAEDAVRAGAAEGAVAAYDCLAVKDARAVFTVDTWDQKLTLHEAEASPVAGGEARANGYVRLDPGALSDPDAVQVELEADGFDPRSIVASYALKGAATTCVAPEQSATPSTSEVDVSDLAEEENGGWVGALPSGLQSGLRQLISSGGPLGAIIEQSLDEAGQGNGASSSGATAAGTIKNAQRQPRKMGPPFGLPPAVYDKIIPAMPGRATATITGPHAAPVVDAQWDVKDAGISGKLCITRNRIAAEVRAPAVEFSGAVDTSYPPLEVALAARTIDDALAAGCPAFTAAEADATFRSLDLAALVVAEDDLARLAPPDRLRLRLSGRMKVKGSVEGAGGASADSLPKVTPASVETARVAALQFAANGIDTTPKAPYTPSVDGKYDPRFIGEASLEGLRVNQLLLAPRLAGEVEASVRGASMNARGRADEHLRFQLDIPAAAAAPASTSDAASDVATTADSAAEEVESPAPSVSVSIRRGLLRAEVGASDGRGDVEVAGLRLDDLELASLRGRVERAKLSVDLRARHGVATLRVQQPRLSGVQGEVLDANASWGGRIVRLERAALNQRRSQYTLQGEHCLDDTLWESLPPPRPEPVFVAPTPTPPSEDVVEEAEGVEAEAQDEAAVESGREAEGEVVAATSFNAAIEEDDTAVTKLDDTAEDDVNDVEVVAASAAVDSVADSDEVQKSDDVVEDGEWVIVAREDSGEGVEVEEAANLQEEEVENEIEAHALSDADSHTDSELGTDGETAEEDAQEPTAASDEGTAITFEVKVTPLERMHGFFASLKKPEAPMGAGATDDLNPTVLEGGAVTDENVTTSDAVTTETEEGPVEAVEAATDSSLETITDGSSDLPDDVPPDAAGERGTSDGNGDSDPEQDQAGSLSANEAVIETEMPVPEAKPSINPLAGVMDRLTAIATKVTEGSADAKPSDEATAATASALEATSADIAAEEVQEEEEPSQPPVEMDPGAWRLLLTVPQADVEEMLPAVRLAAALREGATPLEYTRAKDHFLDAVRRVAIKASDELGRQLEEAAAAAAAEQRASGGVGLKGAVGDTVSRSPGGDAPVQLPGLQDLRGAWRGSVEIKGGSDDRSPSLAATPGNPASKVSAVDFDVTGDGWQWGPYQMQSLQAQGNIDAVKGLHLRRLELRSDGAVFTVDGNLFGEVQDAAFAVIDMPAQRLAPIIHHITSAASASAGAPPPPPPPLPTIAGTFIVSGDVGGSISQPTGRVLAYLSDGRIGTVRMAHATFNAEITPERTARFAAEFKPAPSNKRGTQLTPGHLRLSGDLPLPDAEDRSIAFDWSVQDGGMQLVSALSAPSLGTGGPVEWQAGGADITLAVRGTLADPVYDGSAVITRAKIVSPLLARPLYPVSANVRIQRNTLYADHFDAKCGPRGAIKVRGAVPVLPPRRGASGDTWEGLVARADVQGGIRAEATGLDVRARSAYSGRLDANLVVKGTLLEPEVGGSLRLSKGTAFIQPNAAPSGGGSGGGGGTSSRRGSGLIGFISREREARRGLAGFLHRPSPPGSPSTKGGGKGAGMDAPSLGQLPLRFRGLRLIVGPELSAVYPFVLNFGVSGEVEVNGAADPVLIRPSGVISFERGEINLVATQVRLSREHPNRAVFVPEHGLDPTLDVSLVGADIRALVQGKASNWTDSLVITSGSSRSGAASVKSGVVGGGAVGGKVVGGVGTGDQIVGPSDRDAAVAEAARIFEGQLADSLLEQDGQLAFSNLAASTVATLMPKIETGGQLGKARWRVTTAPSIPGLLSLDPSTDPFRNISQFTLGSDWELMLGDSLQATMSRKLKDSEMQTKFALVYKLTDKLRMQLNSESSTATRLLFEFTTNTNTNTNSGGGDGR